MHAASAIAINPESRARAVAFLDEDRSRERGGFLIGRLPAQPRGVTRIERVVPCPDAPSTAYSLTFRAEEWQLVHADAAIRSGDAQIVGWFHSHPDMPVRMSAQDRFIQRNFFSHPGHVAWIRDPIGGSEAFWVLREDGSMVALEASSEERAA